MLIKQIHSRLEYIKHCDIYEARTEIDKLINIIAETEKCQQLLEIQAKLDELLKSPVVEYKTDWTGWAITLAVITIVCVALAM